ncbi:MAG: VCBS repeat-containing protein [Pyrinomonadaceae bacterium]|nr:VCBS repeat-containing protein [Pyrinomonadaceae bacterium]
MKKFFGSVAVLGFVLAIAAIFLFPGFSSEAQSDIPVDEVDVDMPKVWTRSRSTFGKEEFLNERAKSFGLRRGLTDESEPDPQLRSKAIDKMEKQEADVARMSDSPDKNALLAAWTAIGPNPIPNGSFPWSGRVIAIAVHPTNANIVYVGAAQGGLYRSTDGGTNWTPLMDNALSLAIGAIAISPSQPETVYVGTGEHNFSTDSFFGVGVYRIDNASTTANLSGPFNKTAANADIFTGRGIGEIVVHPTDPNVIFVASTSGGGGISGSANNVLPARGIYRSNNAAGAAPTFTKMTGLAANLNASVRDIAIDPSNANILVANLIASGGAGGIYRSANALAADPTTATFTQVEIFNSTSTSELTAEFTAIHPAANADATFYAATGNLGGRVLRSTNGGLTWVQQIDNNFCTPQCFYDIAVAVDPVNPDRLYLAGSPNMVIGFSSTAGTAFTNSGAGVHVDSHAIAVSQSDPNTLYLGTDGGIYKSINGASSFTSLNNTQFFATQFMGLSVHPTDPNFTIGGTQDNGTNYYSPGATWARVDGGDGGYTVIDQNATDTTNVRMYHTYYNSISGTLVGYATRATTSAGWGFRGCNGTPANGINCTDTAVLFYAPLEAGPGNPNSIYYGSDRIYRSDDAGLNHTVVSQAPIETGVPVSAIGISPQNDGVRIVGLANGSIYGTSTGSTTLTNLDTGGAVPNGFIARAVIDPNTVTTAYVTLSSFGVTNVYKTTNFNSATPTWTAAAGSGGTALPLVPVSGFIVDPLDSNTLYAGTDIGVYKSSNGGTSWAPFGTGLPRVAVFDVAIAPGSPRKLRVATHGKGMYEISLATAPTVRSPFDFDGDNKTDISIFRPAPGEWWYSKSSNGGNGAVTFGTVTDTLTPGDFTGDGKTDVAFYRPSSGNWFVLRSEDFSFYAFPFGTTGDVPVPADYDADGKADAAIFRPSTNTWFINNSGGGTTITGFGTAGDLPVPADYDGDGKADVAIFRPSLGQWWLQRSTAGLVAVQFGQAGDKTVPGDFTGDGKADVAYFRPATGTWTVLRSEDFSFYAFPFGTTGDVPSPGDYDGDGRMDAAVFRPTTSTWFANRSTAGTLIQAFGQPGDISVPNSFVR